MDLSVATLVNRCKATHQLIREEIAGLTPAQLAHVPWRDTSSIATLVIHTLGSEAEVWSIVAGRTTARDRPAEFTTTGNTVESLIARIDAADQLLDELARQIDRAALEKMWSRPNRDPQQGIQWLIQNFGHAREHFGHLQLTKQLLPDVYPPLARPS